MPRTRADARAAPELKKYMDKRLFVNVQANRKISGVLRGFDIFMNLVLDDATDETNAATKTPLGTIVRRHGRAGG